MIGPGAMDNAATLDSAEGPAGAMALQVAQVLRGQIVKGDLKPGDRIVERLLSVELGVSRTPVREALKLLELDGLVRISRNRGAEVTSFSPDEALMLFDVIAVLEGLAARRLAETITPDVLARLEERHARMEFHYRRSQIEPYFEENSAIHDLVLEACGNPELAANHQRLMLRARRGRYMAIMSPDRWAQSVDEHGVLMEALRARDPDAAAEVWTMHLRHTGETLAEVLAEMPAAAPRRRRR